MILIVIMAVVAVGFVGMIVYIAIQSGNQAGKLRVDQVPAGATPTAVRSATAKLEAVGYRRAADIEIHMFSSTLRGVALLDAPGTTRAIVTQDAKEKLPVTCTLTTRYPGGVLRTCRISQEAGPGEVVQSVPKNTAPNLVAAAHAKAVERLASEGVPALTRTAGDLVDDYRGELEREAEHLAGLGLGTRVATILRGMLTGSSTELLADRSDLTEVVEELR